jgi:CP family cyanate transporter-like MFS transporter
VVKQRFPDRVGAMTGLYSVALNLGASTAAAVTVPLTAGVFGGDWRLGLGVWAVIAAAALPAWILLARDRTPSQPTPAVIAPAQTAPALTTPGVTEPGLTAPGLTTPAQSMSAQTAPGLTAPAQPTPVQSTAALTAPGTGGGVAVLQLRREPIAWALAVYFGLQSTAAYVIMGWLPQIFRDAGLSARTAGLLFAVTALLGVPLSFVLSALAGRLPRQSGVAVLIGLFGIAGYAGLWFDPAAAPWLWVVLLGVANCSFPLVLTMIALRGRDAATVSRLSAFAQSTGYLLSVPGPIVVGVLYDHTGSWRIPLALLTFLMVPQMIAGVLAGRDRQIG